RCQPRVPCHRGTPDVPGVVGTGGPAPGTASGSPRRDFHHRHDRARTVDSSAGSALYNAMKILTGDVGTSSPRTHVFDAAGLPARARAVIGSMRCGLAICAALLGLTGPAAGQEIRPTLDKIKETGVIQMGYRETARPFAFRGSDGQPTGFSVELCLQVAGGI